MTKHAMVGPFPTPSQPTPAPVQAARNVEIVRRENSTAGMGAFMVLTGLLVVGVCGRQIAGTGMPWLQVALCVPAFAGVGIVVTGALNFWRHSIDELNDWRRIKEKDEEIRRLRMRVNDLVDYGKDLEYRLGEYAAAASATITVVDREGTREMPRWDAVDAVIHQWLTEQIFDEAGRLVGTHPNGQIKRAMPFKRDERGLGGQAYRRAAALGLVRKDEHGYMYTGPMELTGAVGRLQQAAKEE